MPFDGPAVSNSVKDGRKGEWEFVLNLGLRASALHTVLLAATWLDAATVREMDREAQAYFDKRDYNQAIGLWLTCLEQEPDNEKIQLKIEIVYEIKQRKDIAFQRAKLNYRFARKKARRAVG